MQEILKLIAFILTHNVTLYLALFVVFYAVVMYWAWLTYGPRDTTGNGITVGDAKAFDNRALTLRIERLSSQLATLKVVDGKVTGSIGKIQKQTSTESTHEVSVDAKLKPAKAKAKEGDSGNTEADTNPSKSTSKTSAQSAESATNPPVELAASDILSDQLNLASQILNLETLYERSLTDRLLGNKTRLQTVLGFQVSITPPRGCEDAVAVVEIGVRMKATYEPVSLVALIPHEKTYNSQTFSTSAHSISGSAVTNVLTLGVNRRGETRQLFIHRDSDTVAFERDDQSKPSLFENYPNERVFGWEFRPVLGRRSVAPGTRQMLAVLALPVEDSGTEAAPEAALEETATEAEAGVEAEVASGAEVAPEADGAPKAEATPKAATTPEAIVEVRTRSYWRHFNRRKQTTGSKWGLFPTWIDRSMRVDSRSLDLAVPTTKQIQDALAPRVTDVKWVNSGGDRATVIVTGSNFFTGTKVVIGGVEHREDDEKHKLTLKSNQALEFETTMSSLGKGDCVLSGRFGPSQQLLASLDKLKKKNKGQDQDQSTDIEALTLVQAVISPRAFTDAVYLVVDVKAINSNAEDVDLEVSDIQKLPEPILFVGTESIPLPYDYFDATPDVVEDETHKNDAESDSLPAGSNKEPTAILSKPSARKYVRVGAWISKKLAASPSVTFRVPFCGLGYQASLPLIYSDPTVSRLGDEDGHCVFRIASPVGFKKPFQVELDKVYTEGPDLQKTSLFDYRFKVPIATAARYRNIVVRTGDNQPYVVPINVEEKPKPKTTLTTSGKPPQIRKSTVGSIEWSGTALNLIRTVTLHTRKPDPDSAQSTPVSTELAFTAYEEGRKLEVYYGKADTEVPGKAELEFLTDENQKITAPIFIADSAELT